MKYCRKAAGIGEVAGEKEGVTDMYRECKAALAQMCACVLRRK